MTVLLILVSKLLLIKNLFLLFNPNKSEAPPIVKVTGIICPNICKGEQNYALAFSVPIGYTIIPSSGTVVNDSIVGISPTSFLSVRIIDNDYQETVEEIPLPVCEYLIPQAPLVAGATICEGTPIPMLTALSFDQNAVIEWYDKEKDGSVLATGNSFTPTQSGIYYASTRFLDTNCASNSRTSATITELRTNCIVVSARLIRR